MKTLKNILYILPLSLAIACAPEFDEDIPSGDPGSADFTNYVAVGNSLTAGYQSSALRRKRQENSFPAILAEQMKLAGGGEFKQPLLDAGVGIGNTLNAELALGYTMDCKNERSLGPVPSAPQGQIDQFAPAIIGATVANGPYNNVGVPGAKSFHLAFSGYDTLNPFYQRFAIPNEPVINHAVRANPTFFSLWIGNNDVLGYALAGGSSDAVTPNTQFNQVYTGLITALTTNGAKGVVANIPNITSIPHFTTIPTSTPSLRQGQADTLNFIYASYNADLDSAVAKGQINQPQANKRKIFFTAGANPWVIIDTDLNGFVTKTAGGTWPPMRQMNSGELLTLTTPQNSLKCDGMGTASPLTGPNPIPAQYALTRNEIKSINDAVTSYNITIKQLADANGLAFVDANAILEEMEKGLSFNGVTYSTEFVSGGAFSLDGVHPNTVGYAIIANAHIDAINSKYGASLQKVNVNNYEGIVFP
ncbi:MAG: G-D-S-L family lipolytic protein [Vicingaceae bacterium]